MATTLSTDLYIPDVWADLAFEQFTGNAVVAQYATQDDSLTGKPGETVTFPKWMLLSDMDDVEETDVLVPEKLHQSASEATIKEAAKAVEFSDKAKLTGIGNVQDEAIRQFGLLAARKVDADLIAAAVASITGGITYSDGRTASDSTPLRHEIPGGKLTYPGIVGAFGKLNDSFDPAEFAALFVRSAQWADIMTDPQFISAAQMQGANLQINRGQVGQILGVPVVVTDRLPAGHALAVKRGALGVMWKRRPLVEQDRDILARTTVVAQNMHYAVKRLADKGVIDITVAA
ncbi:N4-gp56 family major capsid protein [Georgenia faecalis]|uniref:N4-gp56 family major capsid protein n=1 Tax=Georgenia faecalis TaxID=2483799 RepID=UPI000FDBB64C|nr:N4-gp56 family major capsid protein [Georgenia faecalis]